MAIKRQSTSGSAASGKKRRVVLEQCSSVSKALLTSDGLPQRVLKMLSENLDKCLGVPAEDRHAYQNSTIQMVKQVLDALQVGMKEKIDAAQTKLDSTSTSKAARNEASEKAAGEVTSKVEAFEAAKAAHIDSTTAARAAKSAVSAALSAQKESAASLEKATTKKAKLESLMNEGYTPLKDGNTDVNVNDCLKKVKQLCKECTTDPALLDCLEKTLRTAPESRGSFDGTVCENFQGAVEAQVAKIQETISSSEAARAEHDKTVVDVTAALQSAQENQESAKATMDASKAALLDAKEAHASATKAVTDFELELKQVEDDLADANAALNRFHNGPKDAFEELLKYTAA